MHRPPDITIQKYLTNPISTELLAGNFSDGDTIKVTESDGGKLKFVKAVEVEEVK